MSEKEPVRSRRSQFERNLFRGGVVSIDIPKYLEECSDFQSRFVPWLAYFNGKIPKRWEEHWGNVYGDFAEAGKRKIQLSSLLLDAGLCIPHRHVVDLVAKTQKLTPRQIALGVVSCDREEVLAAQRELGVSEDEIREAKVLFFDVCLDFLQVPQDLVDVHKAEILLPRLYGKQMESEGLIWQETSE